MFSLTHALGRRKDQHMDQQRDHVADFQASEDPRFVNPSGRDPGLSLPWIQIDQSLDNLDSGDL